MRYIVDVKSARTPARYQGHPCVVRVLDTSVGPTPWHWVRKGTVRQWGGRNTRCLDKRSNGPRSAYGRALREADALCAQLNQAITQAYLEKIGQLLKGEK